MLNKDNSFLGTGWHFPPAFPGQGANVMMASGDEDVYQSLVILLQTAKFSRLMRPEFYCDVQAYLFGDGYYQSQENIKSTISKAILNNEPRVGEVEVNISTDNSRASVLLIELNYRIRSTNSRQNMVFPFYLNEGTNILPLTGVSN